MIYQKKCKKETQKAFVIQVGYTSVSKKRGVKKTTIIRKIHFPEKGKNQSFMENKGIPKNRMGEKGSLTNVPFEKKVNTKKKGWAIFLTHKIGPFFRYTLDERCKGKF